MTTNPSNSFTFQTYNSVGSVIESQSSGISLKATVGAMTSFTLVPTSLVVGDTTTITVSVTPSHTIPIGGVITIAFPQWNPNSPTPQDYFQSSITCSQISNLSPITWSYSSQLLTISNGVTLAITGGTLIKFSCSGFTNPISTQTISGFQITTLDSSSGQIDKLNTTLTITTPATISGATLGVDTLTTTSSIAGIVQELNNLLLSFTLPVPLNAQCKFKVILPLEFGMSSTTQIKLFNFFGSGTTLSTTTDASILQIDSTSNTISFTSCTDYSSNSKTAFITVFNVKLPSYVKQTTSAQILVTTSANYLVGSVQSGITFTPSPGSLTLVSMVPTNSVVQSTTSIAFSLRPNHQLLTNSKLIITFPTAFTALSTCTVTTSGGIVSPSASCTTSGQAYSITSLLSSIYTPDGTTSFQLTLNSVTLPQTTLSLSGLVISTYIQDAGTLLYYQVDSLTSAIPFSLTAGAVTATVSVANPTTSITSYYTFTFSTEHAVPQNGYVIISYPSQVSISDTSFSSSQSSGTNFPSTPSFTINKASQTITISNGFRSTSTPASTQFTVQIPGITNPLTQQRTNSFTIATYRQDGAMIDLVSGGVYVQMTTSSYMQSVSVTLGSYTNSDVTNYTIQMTANVPIQSNNYIIIGFPTEVTLPKTASLLLCRGTDSTIIRAVTCSYTSRVTSGVQVTLTLASGVTTINALQTFSVVFSGITNPLSTAPTSSFSVSITDASYNSINSNPSSISISTTTPSLMSNSKNEVTQDNTGASQLAVYNLVIYPNHSIAAGGGVQITYPSQITLPNKLTVSLKSSATTSTPTVTYDSSSRVILITKAFSKQFVSSSTNLINITLTGFKNPETNLVTDSFIVQTFNQGSSSTYYYIDWITGGLTLSSLCNYPCQTCPTDTPNTCTSCYQASTQNKLQDNTCVSSCSLGKYFDVASGKCLNCDSTCLNCKTTATTCTQCGLGNFLYLLNGQCLTGCPSGYIADSKINQCVQCKSPCSTCLNTTSTCTSCDSSSLATLYYPPAYSCLSSCPVNISVQQNSQCTPCESSCKSCTNAPNQCTSCESYMKFDKVQSQCLQLCNKGTQIYNELSSTCDSCSSNCATCSGSTSTCTTCSSSLVLNTDNTCGATCNNASEIAINGTCTSCQLPCSQCKNSTSHCTKCAGETYLYNTTCVQYCPLKYEARNDTGQCVLVGLICPSGFSINEAGDGCIPNSIECKSGYMINKGNTACIPSPGFPVPFPFLILSICFGLIVVGSHIRDKFFTKVYTCLIAFIGSQEMVIYLLMAGYSLQLQQYGALVLMIVAIVMLFVSNLSFYIYYKKDILKKDVTFFKWCRMYPRTAKFLPLLALVLNFKVIKFLYSGFFGHESCLVQFENPVKSFLTPLRMVTYFSFVFVYIPVFIADIFIFSKVQWGYQLLVLAIESFLLIICIIVLTILEFRNANKLIMSGDEQYIRIKPKMFDGQTNVMSGLMDMDESTLIRSKVVDDDYEVQLRKRALFSILDQVGKNFFTCQNKGVDLGGNIDYCMTKFDEEKLKLRRAFSLEDIKEEESWVASDGEDSNLQRHLDISNEDEEEGGQNSRRRYSFPLTPRTLADVRNPQFSQTLQDIRGFAKNDKHQDNVYAECKAPEKQKEQKKKKQVSRRTQTYLRELLCLQGEDLLDSDLEIVMEDEAEIEQEYAMNLIDNVIDGLSDSEDPMGRRKGKKKKTIAGKRAKEIPDFELADIMGEFEIDDLGNFIILKGEKKELLDKRERRVNRRGYLVDRFGNVINNKGQVIFKAVELDSDDEIPAPFGFEKRKKNLLNMGEEGEFKVDESGKKAGMIEDDEEVINKELKQLKKGKRKRKGKGDGGTVLEEDDEDESSVDSLMADSPGKYQLDQNENEDEIIDKVTKKKIPKKRGNQRMSANQNKKLSPKRGKTGTSPEDSHRKRQGSPQGNAPPRRIMRDDTKEMFPSLAIENSEQKKLYKLAESIGGMAQRIADDQRVGSAGQNQSLSQERLDKLKQEHFRDIINSSQGARHGENRDMLGQQPVSFSNIGNRIMGDPTKSSQAQDRRLPPRHPMEKVYGNLGDVVSYEERQILDQIRAGGASPFSSQLTSRLQKQEFQGGDRRLRGLESIYLQKFDKKLAKAGGKKINKAKFRSTLNQFVDDPERLLDDGGMDFSKQNEVSLMVAEKLDRLQRQYMSNTASNKFEGYVQGLGSGGMPSTGGALGRKPGSVSGSIFNQDSLEPIKKGNWVEKQ